MKANDYQNKKCKDCLYLLECRAAKTHYRCSRVRGKNDKKEFEFLEDHVRVSYNQDACRFFDSNN